MCAAFVSVVVAAAAAFSWVGGDGGDGGSTAMSSEAAPPSEAIKRLVSKKQTLDDAYAAPANFLEIDVSNPITHGVARKRYTDYEVRMKVRDVARSDSPSWQMPTC